MKIIDWVFGSKCPACGQRSRANKHQDASAAVPRMLCNLCNKQLEDQRKREAEQRRQEEERRRQLEEETARAERERKRKEMEPQLETCPECRRSFPVGTLVNVSIMKGGQIMTGLVCPECGLKAAKDYDPFSWVRCENDDVGFWFSYPRGWVQIPHPSAMLLRPPDANSFNSRKGGTVTQVFSPALTLMVTGREGGPSKNKKPDEVLTAFVGDLHLGFSDFHEDSQRKFTLPSGQPAIVVHFSFSKDGRRMRAMTLVAITLTLAYIFDGSAVEVDWAKWAETLEKCLNSLHLSEQ